MSFYTALTGLNAATAQMGVTSNNIANVSTTGFKRSRTDFGDIFATSPLQKASATIGQGVALKKVTQEFGQGNLVFSSNTLDLAISGDGFFPLKSQDGFQDIFTRNGVFMMNDQNNVVNSAGQKLMAASVDSSGKANLDDMNVLTIPQKTTGMAVQTSKVQLGLNFPADAAVITKDFNRNDPATYNKSTALTVYDAGGNSYLASVYYVKTQNASQATPNNKWQTYVYVGDKLVNASLQQATNTLGEPMFVNKYGELKAKSDFKTPEEIAQLNSSFSKKTIKFALDNLTDVRTSQPATVETGLASNLGTGTNDGINFANYINEDKSKLLSLQGSNATSYELTGTATATGDTVSVTFGTSSPQEVVSAAFNKTELQTYKDLATNLNSNATFAAAYVAKVDDTDPAAPKLLVTALDSTVPSSDISSAFVVEHTTGTAAKAAITAVDVASTNPKASITFAKTDLDALAAGDSFQIEFGQAQSGGARPFVKVSPADNTTKLTSAEIVQKLNADADFSTTLVAKLDSNGNLQINAKDWSITDLTDATTGLTASTIDTTSTSATVASAASSLGGSAPDQKYIGKSSVDDLKNLFTINVDNSTTPVTVGLDRLVGQNIKLSGAQVAAELTNEINRAYGDEKPFNFSNTAGPTFSIQLNTSTGTTGPSALDINLSSYGDMTNEQLVQHVQDAIDANVDYKGVVTASYDTQLQQLVFTTAKAADKVTISSKQLGLTDPLVQGVNSQSVGLGLAPSVSTPSNRPLNDQRYGIKVEYDSVKQTFVFKSGTTGDSSGVAISGIRPGSLATQTSKGLGMTGDPSKYIVDPSTVDALRGISSQPAVLTGNALAVNVDNNFSVDSTNNQFVVSVNGITGTVVVPPKDTYTMGTFMEALQHGINNLQGPSKNGLTPESVNGVKVTYNTTKNALEFTTGTASTDSYIKITGDARWGLDGLDAKFGTTTTWIKPTPFKDDKGATVYIDGFGAESSTASGFDTLPAWSPVYFDKGELTFDTAGNLVSPKQGAQLDTVYLPNGKGALTINIDYSKSTQFASPFSVLSQSQDGAPEGDLVGLAIKDDGLVSASFSNGAQKSLGKVVLVNFSNASGLRQIGDTNYYKTSDSGTPKYGEAGSAGFGTVRSGATERANVDLTQELVDLITEQRNFQANAKAMETSTSMTNTIIQIRN